MRKLSLFHLFGVVPLGVVLGDLKTEEEAGDAPDLETVVFLGVPRGVRLELKCGVRLAFALGVRLVLRRGERRVATRGSVFGVLGRPMGGRQGDGCNTNSWLLLAPWTAELLMFSRSLRR